MRRFLIAGLGALVPMVWKELQKSLLKDYVVKPLRRWGAALLNGVKDLFGLGQDKAPAGQDAPAPAKGGQPEPAAPTPPYPCDHPGAAKSPPERAPDTRSPGDALDGPVWDAFTRAVQAETTPLPVGEAGDWGQELARRRRLEAQAVPSRIPRTVSQRLSPSRPAKPSEGWTKGLAPLSERPDPRRPQPEVWQQVAALAR